MVKGTEYYNVSNCPLCKKPHEYLLEVERSTLVKIFKINDMDEEPVLKEFSRLLYCPVNKNYYQATISVRETSFSKIDSVEVFRIKDKT